MQSSTEVFTTVSLTAAPAFPRPSVSTTATVSVPSGSPERSSPLTACVALEIVPEPLTLPAPPEEVTL